MNKRCNVSDRKNPTCEDNTWGKKYQCNHWIKDLDHAGQPVCTYADLLTRAILYPFGYDKPSCNCASAISAAIEQEDTND
jgi:hypothetical protein